VDKIYPSSDDAACQQLALQNYLSQLEITLPELCSGLKNQIIRETRVPWGGGTEPKRNHWDIRAIEHCRVYC